MKRLRPFFPKSRGRPRVDNRRVLSGIIYVKKNVSKQIVYYWCEQRGQRVTSDYRAKASVVWDSLTRGRTDGALVRFVTAIAPGETEAEAEARMQRFMREVLARLPRFIPA
jgi:EpsI family protein